MADLNPLGSLISAGASIYGGMEAKKAQEDRIAADREMAAQNIQLQKDFAQQGIRWKVADAEQAGINPLFALGASTTSFSPVSVGSTVASGLADSLSSAGQDIGRAVSATMTGKEREDAFETKVKEAQLKGLDLDNQIKATQIASGVQRLKANSNPAMATGTKKDGLVGEDDPSDRKKQFIGGTQIKTDPNTTSMQDFEDRYGDEGLPTWLIPPFIMWQDFKANVGEASRAGERAVLPGSLLDRWMNRMGVPKRGRR